MRLNHPLKEEYLQLKSALSLRVWLFKQNQLPAIRAWFARNKDTAVIVVGLIGVGFVAGQLASESEMMSRADAVRLDGMSEGVKMAEYDFKGAIKREMFKAEKVAFCMGFWFKEDHEFVGKALQAVKVSK